MIVLMGPLYAVREGWPAARRRWAADLAVLALVYAWVYLHWKRSAPSASNVVAFVPRFVHDAVLLQTWTVVPIHLGRLGAAVVLVAEVAVLAVAIQAFHRLGPEDAARAPLGRWLVLAGSAVLALPFAWVLLLGSGALSPLGSGIDDRANIGAALPLALLAWSLAMLAATLVRLLRPKGGHTAAVVLGALLLLGYAWQARARADEWTRAAEHSRAVLAAIRGLPLPPRSTVYTFGAPAQTAPRVPVFIRFWELSAAVRVDRNDRSISAYPVYAGSHLVCGATGVHARLSVLDEREGLDPDSHYGQAVLVDVPSHASAVLRSRRDCLAELPRFHPGPVLDAS
jgi:hypothetical protein